MTPIDNLPPDEDEEREGKDGKGKAEGSGAAGAVRTTVSPAFFDFMARIGASMEQISRIMTQWAHLRGESLTRALNDFARDVSRASSQPQVQFDGKDFSLVTTLLRYLTGRDRTPTSRPPQDNSPKSGPR
jgi:hypothetical protein